MRTRPSSWRNPIATDREAWRRYHDDLVMVRWFQSPQPPDGVDPPDSGEPTGRARWILALGIISLAFGPLGVCAWLAGNACLAAIADGRADPACEANARAGRMLGMIALCLFTLKVSVLSTLAIIYWMM